MGKREQHIICLCLYSRHIQLACVFALPVVPARSHVGVILGGHVAVTPVREGVSVALVQVAVAVGVGLPVPLVVILVVSLLARVEDVAALHGVAGAVRAEAVDGKAVALVAHNDAGGRVVGRSDAGRVLTEKKRGFFS